MARIREQRGPLNRLTGSTGVAAAGFAAHAIASGQRGANTIRQIAGQVRAWLAEHNPTHQPQFNVIYQGAQYAYQAALAGQQLNDAYAGGRFQDVNAPLGNANPPGYNVIFEVTYNTGPGTNTQTGYVHFQGTDLPDAADAAGLAHDSLGDFGERYGAVPTAQSQVLGVRAVSVYRG